MNTDWGFGGTHEAGAWDMAHEKIMTVTNSAPYAVADFLDSRYGRQFADDVSNALLTTPDMVGAIDAAIVKWMGWSITKATAKQHGIPEGLPYLTGFVCSFEQ
jgi:hypothetical protein